MPPTRIVSVHEYELQEGVDEEDLLKAVEEAEKRGLFDLPGLVGYRLLRGIKGSRQARMAAIWIYESRSAWEALWGPPDAELPKGHYPRQWREWEEELLAPLLDRDPDRVNYTSYEELAAGEPGAWSRGPSGR